MALPIHAGGVLSPHEVIGRDQFIARLWETLKARQNIRLNAERRMGKTAIIQKMVAESPQGVMSIYRDVEFIRSPIEFLETVLEDTDTWLTDRRKAKEWLSKIWRQVAGGEVKGFKLPPSQARAWKSSFQTMVREVADQVPEQIVFFWDEMPLMLHNIKRTQGEEVAMEVLDTLRELRQANSSSVLRMVFTGSIGLHHVLSDLRRAGYANRPLNDMEGMVVPPLDFPDACYLAGELLEGIGVASSTEREQAAQEIAAATDCIPFYIHHLVKRVRDYPQGIAPALAQLPTVRQSLLFDPQDALDLKYYEQRIATYYLPEQQSLAFATLDAMAHKEPLVFKTLHQRVKLKAPTTEEESLRETLSLLEMDHYLQQTEEGYRFQRQLIRDGWRARRGIR